MRNVRIDADAVRCRATAQGIEYEARLAAIAGLDRSVLWRIMHGARLARPAHVLALADALSCPPGDLLHPDEADLADRMNTAAAVSGAPEAA